jgi:hypothetical protein
MRWRPGVTLALILLAGCVPAQRVIRMQASDYYPLAVGTTWVFRGPGQEHVMRVVRHELVGTTACALVETQEGDTVMESDVFARRDGVFLMTLEGQKLSEPMQILKLPPYPGAAWKINFNFGGKRSQGSYVLGQQTVTVPYGKFNAITVRGEFRDGDKLLRTLTVWYAAGVGIVKQEIQTGDDKMVYELTKFERGR